MVVSFCHYMGFIWTLLLAIIWAQLFDVICPLGVGTIWHCIMILCGYLTVWQYCMGAVWWYYWSTIIRAQYGKILPPVPKMRAIGYFQFWTPISTLLGNAFRLSRRLPGKRERVCRKTPTSATCIYVIQASTCIIKQIHLFYWCPWTTWENVPELPHTPQILSRTLHIYMKHIGHPSESMKLPGRVYIYIIQCKTSQCVSYILKVLYCNRRCLYCVSSLPLSITRGRKVGRGACSRVLTLHWLHEVTSWHV